MLNSNKKFEDNGLAITPADPRAHDSVKVIYNGLLVKSGAGAVWAHVGFDGDWNHVNDYKMEKTDHGFTADIPMQYADTLNIAFKDCASNWDNNSGNNYSFHIAH